jgi:hypothetical protein
MSLQIVSKFTRVPDSTNLIPLGTSIFQPADVGQNRIIKQILHQMCLEHFVNRFSKALSDGSTISVEDYKAATSIDALRQASVAPLVHVHEYFHTSEGRQVILRVSDILNVQIYSYAYLQIVMAGLSCR